MSLVLQSSGGGSITLQEPATASNRTINIADVTGTLNVAGPAFHVHKNGTNQTGVADAVETLVTFSTELFDTANCFSSNRFTPNVAGYYLFNGAAFTSGTGQISYCSLYKNGALSHYGTNCNTDIGNVGTVFSVVLYMNGTTDYVEMFIYTNVSSGTGTVLGAADSTYFCGCFLRSA